MAIHLFEIVVFHSIRYSTEKRKFLLDWSSLSSDPERGDSPLGLFSSVCLGVDATVSFSDASAVCQSAWSGDLGPVADGV